MFYSSARRFSVLCCLFFFGVVQAEEVRVAVAANFLATAKILAPLYEKGSGDKLIISGASSGKLYAQIINGAPYDVFLSADRRYPEKLIDKRKGAARSRYVYAKGALVLWGTKMVPIDENSLKDASLTHIALANPRTAPYGMAAKQVMQKIGVWDTPKFQKVMGESVGQSFQFVATGNVQLGFVALSQVLSPLNRFNRESYWKVPTVYYEPLEQEALLLSRGEKNPAASRFLNFLKGDEAREIMARYGYFVD